MKVSDCCSAPATELYSEDLGICPECKEHCEFVDPDDDEDEPTDDFFPVFLPAIFAAL